MITEQYVWTTKNGAEIPLSKMEDSHLKNSYNMMLRTNVPFPPVFLGEDAEMCADADFEQACADREEWLLAFKDEAEKRGINLND